MAEKCPLFILSKDEILVKNMPTCLQEKKTGWRQWTLILIFCVDVHLGLDKSSPTHMRPPEPDPLPPPCGRHKWMAPISRNNCFCVKSVYAWNQFFLICSFNSAIFLQNCITYSFGGFNISHGNSISRKLALWVIL